MTLIITDADYTSRDFDSLRARAIDLLLSGYPNADTETADFQNMLLELLAFVGDRLSFYQDMQARERFRQTARLRRSMIDIAAHFGQELFGAGAATAAVVFSVPSAGAADVVFPAGTQVRTNAVVDPVRFQTLEEVTLLAGETSVEAQVEQSENQAQTFAASGVPSQEIYLSRSPYLDASLSINTLAGAWEEVDNFLLSGATDRHFVVTVDELDRAKIRFGDGVRGAKPSGTITASYKTGGGDVGNVSADSITVIPSSVSDVEGRAVIVSVTNPSAASGGVDRESVEAARVRLPASLRATSRSVTKEDFETHATEVVGVARAVMVTSDIDASVDENAGIVYVVPEGGGEASETLLDDVLEQVTETYPPTLTFSVQAFTATYKEIDVWVSVRFSDGVSKSAVRASIVDAIEAFFSIRTSDGALNSAMDFGANLEGQEVAWSDVFNAARDVSGVRKIEPTGLRLNNAVASVSLGIREFPSLGSVTVVDAATGSVV
ncbi:MAG: baseplate J/gp47 family protein [Gammaproteobacteria bacterium]|nr:baseplate J/gp47 family protein [Gammaproteobacteria bacterium]